jgi:hypothetical protein
MYLMGENIKVVGSQVFNSKLSCFATMHKKCMAFKQAILELQIQARFSAVR